MSENKFLHEKQIDSLSFPEPPADFADRVMSAVLQPQQSTTAPSTKKLASPAKSLVGVGLIAAAFASGVLVSPMLRSTKETRPLQLQAVTPTTNTQPAGGTMSSGYTALGALSLLGAFLGPLGPLAEPNQAQTKKFCKEAVVACEESPEPLCESVWELCIEKPKKEARPPKKPSKDLAASHSSLDDLQGELDDLQGDIEDIAGELDDCYQEESCSEQEIKELNQQLEQEIKKLQKKASKLDQERFEFEFKLFTPEAPMAPIAPLPPLPPLAPIAPRPPVTPIAPLPPIAPLAPFSPKAPRPPVAPNWSGSVVIIQDGQVIIKDADEFDSDCEECQREMSLEDALRREQARVEKYQEELEAAIEKYQADAEKYEVTIEKEIRKEKKKKKDKKRD